MLKLFRWMYGYVSFKVTGGCPEKFLNAVAKDKINLWDLKKSNGDLYAKVLAPEYKLLRPRARKANSKMRIIKKRGRPIIILKYRKRLGLAIGGLLFLFILKIFSLFIWDINIVGAKDIPIQDILTAINEAGVSMGTKKSSIDSNMVQQSVMAKLPDISWMSVNLNGSCLNVAIKERIKTPELVKPGEPCNVVSCTEGQIERMEVYKGTPCVKIGDAVTSGEVLISGIGETEDGKSTLSEADGKVFAKTKRKLTESVKLSQLGAVDTGKKLTRYKMDIFGKNMVLNPWCVPKDESRVENEKSNLKFLGLEFPTTVYKETYYEQMCDEKVLDIEEAKRILEQNLLQREKDELLDVKILSTAMENYEKDNECFLEATITCIENIAKKESVSSN